MASGVRGDFAELESLLRNLTRLQRLEHTKDTLEAIGAKSIELIEQGISRQVDPYGSSWRERRAGKNRGRGPVLRGLIGTFSHSMRGRLRVLVQSSDTHAALHQHGTKRLPRRLLVPLAERGLPKRWAQAFQEIAHRQFLRHFRGR